MVDDIKVVEIKSENFKDLSLMDSTFFQYAASQNLEFAEFLIKPVLDYLNITDYEIISAETEVVESHNQNHGVRLDLKILTGDGRHFLIEIQNTHSERMSLKRLRYERSSHDVSTLKEGEDYSLLPEVILICYTDKPLAELDDGNPVAILSTYNQVTEETVDDGTMIFIINNKYKSKAFQSFSEVIEELAKESIEDIVNPVVRDIHRKAKESEGGQKEMTGILEKLMRENYGDLIDKCERQEERLKRAEEENKHTQEENARNREEIVRLKRVEEENKHTQEENARNQEEIARLRRILEENGLAIEG